MVSSGLSTANRKEANFFGAMASSRARSPLLPIRERRRPGLDGACSRGKTLTSSRKKTMLKIAAVRQVEEK